MGAKPWIITSTSDQHAGSTMGLFPPEGVRGPDGNQVLPNTVQAWSWIQWERFWSWVGGLKKDLKANLANVYVGDLAEGSRFASGAQTISPNQEPRAYILDRTLGKKSHPWALGPKHTFCVRGTEAHVGPVAEAEEAFARGIKAERTPSDAWSWWVLRQEWYGILFDFRHHPSNYGTKPWTAKAAAIREARQVLDEHIDAGTRPPELAIRGHVHYHADSHDAHRTRAIFLPPWQLKTMHAHRVASNAFPTVGGIATVILPDGTWSVHKQIYQPEVDQPWRP